MRKKWIRLLSVLMLLCLAVLPTRALADGQKVVTLGADLSEEQRTAILKYFGVLGQNVQTIYITNADERAHLGSYVPLEQIGTRTFSCALVNPKPSGGIQVKTANLNWVTSNMIATTLSTSGVVNCEVLAASPFPVSGTGALTGIIMAYESAVGTALPEAKKEIATQELITTGTIADQVGQAQATNIVNEIKIQVIQGQASTPEEVVQIVDDVADTVQEEEEIYLSEDDRELLYELMTQIAQQQYDYDDMKDTLERVEQNVQAISDTLGETESGTPVPVADADADEAADDETEEETEETLDPDSILLQTDDSALGEGVLIDATNQEAVAEVPAAAAPEEQAPAGEDFGFEIVSGDSYGEESGEEGFYDDGTGEEGTFTDGEGTDEFIEEDGGEEFAEDEYTGEEGGEEEYTGEEGGEEEFTGEEGQEAAAFEVGRYCLTPDSTWGTSCGAGIGTVALLLENADIIPVSGTLTVADPSGMPAATVELADTAKVRTAPISEHDRQVASDNGFTPQTKILFQLGTKLERSTEYMVTVDGVVGPASAPEVSSAISAFCPVSTAAYGVSLEMASLQDVVAGASLAGQVIFDENMATASITAYDGAMIAFDTTELSVDAPAFTLFCQQPGATAFTVTYYDWDGAECGSVNYELTIF